METLKLIEKSKRNTKTQKYFNMLKQLSASITNKGTYKKWKTVNPTDRITVSLTVYEVKLDNNKFFVISDTLGRVAFNEVIEEQSIIDWLEEKGYKTEKEFFLSNGMTEEIYKEWCSE